ncbi:MAG: amino acid adenylation domain-containing protein [Lachnospiraceae bacterium]|nr:amino acid adenylation domain-containing protein [Lachnospiraceae bacterium]
MADKGFDSVVSMFERQVAACPDKKAVIGNNTYLTYSEFNEYTNRIANSLIYYGALREDIVMIFMPRNFMYYAVNMGVLKSGAAFIYVSITYPEDRVEYILKDSDSKFIITTRKLYEQNLKKIVTDEVKVLFLEELVSSQWNDDPHVDIHENDLAYCIYTSGTTGKPKGAMIEHGNLSNYLEHNKDNTEVMDIVENCKVMLAFATFTFDASVMEEFISLTSGMSVVVTTDEQLLNPEVLSDIMVRNNVDGLVCTPSYMDRLLSMAVMEPAIKGLRIVDIGGETFPGELYTKIRAANPDVVIINAYGPTETTIVCLAKRIVSAENIRLGKPLANVYCFVVDKDLNEVPRGEPGELLICGKGVGRGYRNLEEKTKEVFVTFKGMRGYRSGDLVVLEENGEIDFHGRIDSQVKVRGLRIELEEVDNILGKCDIVSRCAATALDNRYLCLYYTPKDLSLSEEVTKETLREYAKKHLAPYMIPDFFIRMEDMPVTNNWKIDRAKLPRPEIKASEGQKPSNDLQKEIVRIISDVIKRPFNAVDVDFIKEGLTSLDLMTISAIIGEKHGIPFSIADIVDTKNALGMEKLILERCNKYSDEKVFKAPALFAQSLYHEIWHLYNSTECVMSGMLTLGKDIDTDRLIDSLRRAAKVHAGIFLRFEKEGDRYLISIPEPEELTAMAENLNVMVQECSEENMPDIRATLAEELMEPDGDRYYDFRIYVTEENKYLVLRFAHVIGDGDSVELFIDDIFTAYDGGEITPENINIVQIADEQARRSSHNKTDADMAYFNKLLGDSSHWPKLTDKENSEEAGFDSYEKEINLSADRICATAKKLSVSESIFFASVVTLALSSATGSDIVPMVITYNGRDDYRVDNTFGFLARAVIVCGHIDKNKTVGQYMLDLSSQFLESISKDLPVKELYEKYPGWTDNLFIYQVEGQKSHILQGKTIEEDFLMAEGDESFEQTGDAVESSGYGFLDAIRNTALRWTTSQTSFEIFGSDEGYVCGALAPLGRTDSRLMETVLDEINRIIDVLDDKDVDLKIGELTDGRY